MLEFLTRFLLLKNLHSNTPMFQACILLFSKIIVPGWLEGKWSSVQLLLQEHSSVRLLLPEHSSVWLLLQEHSPVRLLLQEHSSVWLLLQEHTQSQIYPWHLTIKLQSANIISIKLFNVSFIKPIRNDSTLNPIWLVTWYTTLRTMHKSHPSIWIPFYLY